MWEQQLGGGIPSRIYHALYNWWIPVLSEANPYKQLFLAHMAELCAERQNSCSNEPPNRP